MTIETQDPPKLSIDIAPRPDGKAVGIVELFRDANEVFSTGEPGEISFTRMLLRCLGHAAVGSSEQIDDQSEIPPVNPWKLVSAIAHAAVSSKKRRETLSRIGQEMSFGDGMGLLAIIGMHGMGKNAGLSKKEAQSQALNWYAHLAKK